MPDTLVACLRQRTGLAVDATDLVGMTVTLRLSLELHPRWGVSGRIQALAPGIETSLAKSTLEATIARLRREALWDRQLQRGHQEPIRWRHEEPIHPCYSDAPA